MKKLFFIFLYFTILNADIKSLKDSCYDGDFEACGTLALMYAKGDGVSMDKKIAAFFYAQAYYILSEEPKSEPNFHKQNAANLSIIISDISTFYVAQGRFAKISDMTYAPINPDGEFLINGIACIKVSAKDSILRIKNINANDKNCKEFFASDEAKKLLDKDLNEVSEIEYNFSDIKILF